MIRENTSVINRFSPNRSDIVGASRYFNNENISSESMVKCLTDHCSRQVKGKHVLAISDTTEFSFQHHLNFLNLRDGELGPITHDSDYGYFLHTMLALDANTSMGLGYSYVKLWNRAPNKKNKYERKYKEQPIEEKESYRWIESALQTKDLLSSADSLTIVADRESDIYEEFVQLKDKQCDLLIRSGQNRPLYNDPKKLNEYLSSLPVQGSYKIAIRKTQSRSKRTANIDIRFSRVRIKRPAIHSHNAPEYIELNAVEACEKTTANDGIHWRLLTTHKVETIADAMQVIQWYGKRWEIELLFGLLKSAGLNTEESELESGKALKRLTIMNLEVALKILQLKQARDGAVMESARVAYSTQQLAILKVLTKEYEGKTQKQKNPWPKEYLSWVSWIIARMGGWKGYQSEAKPGTKTMKWGLDKLHAYEYAYSTLLKTKLCA